MIRHFVHMMFIYHTNLLHCSSYSIWLESLRWEWETQITDSRYFNFIFRSENNHRNKLLVSMQTKINDINIVKKCIFRSIRTPSPLKVNLSNSAIKWNFTVYTTKYKFHNCDQSQIVWILFYFQTAIYLDYKW